MEQITQSIVLVETRSINYLKGEGRIRHTSVCSDGIIYMFGGSVGTVAYDNTIGIFDTSIHYRFALNTKKIKNKSTSHFLIVTRTKVVCFSIWVSFLFFSSLPPRTARCCLFVCSLSLLLLMFAVVPIHLSIIFSIIYF